MLGVLIIGSELLLEPYKFRVNCLSKEQHLAELFSNHILEIG
jgi:hypothetical protein